MCDIALGMKTAGLAEFAKKVGASEISQWRDLGLYDDDVEGWGQAFQQVTDRTIAARGRIHFDLTDMDIAAALRGDPNQFVARYTAWGLQQVVRYNSLFERTAFYLNGNLLDSHRVAELGIPKPGGEIRSQE